MEKSRYVNWIEDLDVNRAFFLDIDGVLNSDRYFSDNAEAVEYELSKVKSVREIEDSGVLIDSAAVDRVNEILAQVDDLTLFLSSNWRRVDTHAEIETTLQGQGLDYPLYPMAWIPRKDGGSKREHIRHCVGFYEPEDFVVLDDRNLYPQYDDPRDYREHFLQTDSEVGLTDEDTRRIIRYFDENESLCD